MALRIEEYPYTLASVIVNKKILIECTKNSKLLYELNDENIQEIIGVKLNDNELEKLQELQKQKVELSE